MAWLPFEKYTLITRLSPAQLEKKVAEAVDSFEYTVAQRNDAILVKTSDRFKLGGYHQLFKPDAAIGIEIIPNGAKLTIVLKPKARAIAILALIVAMFLAAIWFTQRTNIELGRYKDAAVACAGLLILAYLLPVTAFNGEQAKLKLFIADLFEVEEEN
jgi:hypothetical protein